MNGATNNANARLCFENAVALLDSMRNPDGSKMYNLQAAKLTQSEIRSEVALSTSSNQYHIPILVNDAINGSAFLTEQRLNLQDIFVVNQLGFFVGNPSSASATNYKLFTYENSTIFTGANVASSLATLWNGNFTYNSNNVQVLPYWGLYKHYKAPQTQQAANADYTASGISLVDSADLSTDGFYPVEPGWVFSGAANIDASMNLKSGLAAVLANSRAIFIFRGVLLQNVTSVK